jgi:hypothetical protein
MLTLGLFLTVLGDLLDSKEDGANGFVWVCFVAFTFT